MHRGFVSIKWLAVTQTNNEPWHRYWYGITVYTGLRPRAGTKCKVALRIDGENGISRRILLDSKERELDLKSGSIHSLNAAVFDYLGQIERLQVTLCKSNGQDYDPWFLDRIEITDLTPEAEIKKYDFLCYGWFGKDNLVKTLDVAKEEDRRSFKHVLVNKLRLQLFNDYLWGSIFNRQLPSHFTRVQRLSCITSMLFLTMLVSAMFYNTGDKVAATKTIGYGEVTISLGTLYIAFISCLINIPPAILMVKLFEKSNRLSRILPMEIITTNVDGDGNTTRRNLLPSCCLILGWSLVITSILLSNFFLIMYSLDWGPEVSMQWLVSQLTSCALSAFLIDPLKAIIVAHGMSLAFFLLKKPLEVDNDEEFRQMLTPPAEEADGIADVQFPV
ncbi:polycystin-1-like protein 2 [Glandiceps talaboti]